MRSEQTTVGERALLTVKQAAAYLNLSTRTLGSLISSGELPVIRVGRSVRFTEEDLRRFIEAHRNASSRRAEKEVAHVE